MAKHYKSAEKERLIKRFLALKEQGLSAMKAAEKINGPHAYTFTDWIKAKEAQPAQVEIMNDESALIKKAAKRAYNRTKPKAQPTGKLTVIMGSPKDIAAALLEMGV